jgi:hypothetical protein
MRALPLSTLRNALLIGPFVALNTAGYLLLNHYHLRPPIELSLSALDRAIPFLPWTVWPYALLLASDVVLPLALRDRMVFRDTLVAYVVAIAINFAVWTTLPTIYPRPAAPAEATITTAAYNLLVAIDSPASCFPSGHITIPAVACWGFTREWPRAGVAVWGGLALLALTVLTTKQHYLVDVLGGGGTAMLGVAVARRRAAATRAQEDGGGEGGGV